MNNTLSFQDIIKKSFQSIDFSSSLTTSDIALVLVVTFLCGLFIFYIYRKTFQGILYTQSFNISLIMVSIVTSLIIMTISANIILSLGMVGALSIVRFRTAVKDSMDIVFMFWAISVGIANGAGFFKLSILGTIFVGLILLILTKIKTKTTPYLLVIKYSKDSYDELKKYLDQNLINYTLKSKSVNDSYSELILELRLKNKEFNITENISALSGIKDVSLVSYNGDYVS